MIMITSARELNDLNIHLSIAKQVLKLYLTEHDAHVLYGKLAYSLAKMEFPPINEDLGKSKFLTEEERSGFIEAEGYTLDMFKSDYAGTINPEAIYGYIGTYVITDMLLMDYWNNPVTGEGLASYIQDTFSLSTTNYGIALDEQHESIKFAIANDNNSFTVHEPLKYFINGLIKEIRGK